MLALRSPGRVRGALTKLAGAIAVNACAVLGHILGRVPSDEKRARELCFDPASVTRRQRRACLAGNAEGFDSVPPLAGCECLSAWRR